MKNIIIVSLVLFIIGCKGSNEKSIVINASIDKVWTVFSDLGAHEHFTALDSASLTPSGKWLRDLSGMCPRVKILLSLRLQ